MSSDINHSLIGANTSSIQGTTDFSNNSEGSFKNYSFSSPLKNAQARENSFLSDKSSNTSNKYQFIPPAKLNNSSISSSSNSSSESFGNSSYSGVNKSESSNSFQSTISMQNSSLNSSNSKAVLTALKSLQEKIKKLEIERNNSQNECARLQLQLKSQLVETEHLLEKQKIKYDQDLLDEKRLINEEISQIKNAHEIHYSELNDKYNDLLEENKTLKTRLSESLSEIGDLKGTIEQLKNENKDIKDSTEKNLLWESNKNSTEYQELKKKNDLYLKRLKESENFIKFRESENEKIKEFVEKLIKLNGSLVTQLSIATKKKEKLKNLPNHQLNSSVISKKSVSSVSSKKKKANRTLKNELDSKMKELISSCIEDKMNEIHKKKTKKLKRPKSKKNLNTSSLTNSTISTRLKTKKNLPNPLSVPIINSPKPLINPEMSKNEEEEKLLEYITKLRAERENKPINDSTCSVSDNDNQNEIENETNPSNLSPEQGINSNIKSRFIKNSLDDEIIKLEDEFDELSQRYNHILNGLSASSPSFYPFSLEDFSTQESTQNHADYIVKTINDIHETKEKLKKLQDLKQSQF